MKILKTKGLIQIPIACNAVEDVNMNEFMATM